MSSSETITIPSRSYINSNGYNMDTMRFVLYTRADGTIMAGRALNGCGNIDFLPNDFTSRDEAVTACSIYANEEEATALNAPEFGLTVKTAGEIARAFEGNRAPASGFYLACEKGTYYRIASATFRRSEKGRRLPVVEYTYFTNGQKTGTGVWDSSAEFEVC